MERSLRSSLSQIPQPTKVLFIDQNNNPLTLNKDLSSHPLLECLHLPVKSVSRARNSFSIPEHIDWIIFCDDDGYLCSDYMKKFLTLTHNLQNMCIIAGSIVRDDNGDFYSPWHKLGGDLQKFRCTKLLMGSNFAVKRTTFHQLLKFDEEFGAGAKWGSGEETDFAWKAYFAKIPMVYKPELVVYHIRPYAGSWDHSVKKAFRYGLGRGAIVAKWLVFKHKKEVFYELSEMIAVPIGQLIVHTLQLRWDKSIINAATLLGRILGAIRYSFNRIYGLSRLLPLGK